jgi:sulfoxide reductase catalytic subunit YedY
MSSRHDWNLPESSITPESIFHERRRLLRTLGYGGLALAASPLLLQAGCDDGTDEDEKDSKGAKATIAGALGEKYSELFPAKRNDSYDFAPSPSTPELIAGKYNNFYEFTMKKDVWRYTEGYRVDPWKVRVKGLVKKEFEFGLEDLFRWFPLEERLYRFRCVEAWAMQVPWTGFPLRKLIEKCEPLGSAKHVRVVSVLDPEHLPGQKNDAQWPWPYYEGYRIDEVTHELAMVVLGIYGHSLPTQHGAPWRLVLPWKYGYKSPKSLVEIEFTEKRPGTFWNDAVPSEYGFYSNVNPKKPHPRWSQATERDLGTEKRRDTLPYNGYAEQVAKLYTGKEY